MDQTSPVPIFCVPARASPPRAAKRGEETHERARMLELKLKEEAVFFAAGVGIVQTMRADVCVCGGRGAWSVCGARRRRAGRRRETSVGCSAEAAPVCDP